MTQTIELLYWEGCPSWPGAIEMVREEMAAAGLDPERLIVREITTDDEAKRERFYGSPTILIDGRDVQDPGDNPIGLSCRVYRRTDGTVSPLPDPEDIRRLLPPH
jgi:hypothetical protein